MKRMIRPLLVVVLSAFLAIVVTAGLDFNGQAQAGPEAAKAKPDQLEGVVVLEDRNGLSGKTSFEVRFSAVNLHGRTVTRKQRFSLRSGKDRDVKCKFPAIQFGKMSEGEHAALGVDVTGQVWRRMAFSAPLHGSIMVRDQIFTLHLRLGDPVEKTLTSTEGATLSPPKLTVSLGSIIDPFTVSAGATGIVPLIVRLSADGKVNQVVSDITVYDLVGTQGAPDVASWQNISLYRGNDRIAGPVSMMMVIPHGGAIRFHLATPEVVAAGTYNEYLVVADVSSAADPGSIHTFAVSGDITVLPADDGYGYTRTDVFGEAFGSSITIQ